jgi:hypothetical protein
MFYLFRLGQRERQENKFWQSSKGEPFFDSLACLGSFSPGGKNWPQAKFKLHLGFKASR